MSKPEADHDPPPPSSDDQSSSIETKMAEAQRLCHMIKRNDFDGYGFNLHSEKGKPGQYIGKVDEKSPAEESGLHQGDRIIEVNGVNIGSETHKQVVQRIKAIENEVRLLVIDPDIENQLKQQQANSKQPASVGVEKQQQHQQQQHNNNNNSNSSETSSPSSSLKQLNNNGNKMSLSTSSSVDSSTNGNDTELSATIGAVTPTPSQKTIEANVPNTTTTTTTTTTATIQNGGSSSNSSSSNGTTKKLSNATPSSMGLNLKMTAAEMRAKLQSKKKYDPKNDTVDLRKKFDIIQKL